ncbi:hypothetical protein JCM9534A_05180 [Catenuloplanes indicus JCM 9534]
MQRQHQHHVVGGEPEQGEPGRPLPLQVERCGGQRGRARLGLGLGRVGHLLDGHRGGVGRVDDLPRLAVGQHVPGAQDLVPVHQSGPGVPQRRQVDGAVQSQHQRDQVFGAVRGEAVQEPHLALAGGERQRGGPVRARDVGARAAARAAGEPAPEQLGAGLAVAGR